MRILKSYTVGVGLALALTSCATNTRYVELRPLEGAAASQIRDVILTAELRTTSETGGEMALLLPDGTYCSGPWTSNPEEIALFGAGDLLRDYSPVRPGGISLFIGSMSVMNYARADCSDGGWFEAEFMTGDMLMDSYGIARDERGNIYQLSF